MLKRVTVLPVMSFSSLKCLLTEILSVRENTYFHISLLGKGTQNKNNVHKVIFSGPFRKCFKMVFLFLV